METIPNRHLFEIFILYTQAYSEISQTSKVESYAKTEFCEYASGQRFLQSRLKFPTLDPSFGKKILKYIMTSQMPRVFGYTN